MALTRDLPPLWPMLSAGLAATLLAALIAAPAWRRGERRRAGEQASGVLLVGACAAILIVTFVLGNRLRQLTFDGRYVAGYSANLQPFDSILLQLNNPDGAIGLANVLGNVVMFAPFGMLILLRFRARIWTTVLLGLCFSATIEVAQYFSHRVADIDDVLLNTLGTTCGALLAASLVKAMRGRLQDVGEP